MSDTFLTREEVRELTGRQKYAAQARALRAMGIEFRHRADGTLAVLRGHIENAMGATSRKERATEWQPNWSAA